MPNTFNKISTWFFSFITTFYAISMLCEKKYLLSLQGLLFSITFFLITFKFSRIIKENFLLFQTNSFIFTAAFLGLMLGFYPKILYYDLVIHFYAGVILVWYGFLIYSTLKKRFVILNRQFLLYCLIFLFSVTVLLFWEFAEYFLDVLFLTDHMNVGKTGIHDTMTDLLIGMVGSLLTLYYRYWKKKI